MSFKAFQAKMATKAAVKGKKQPAVETTKEDIKDDAKISAIQRQLKSKKK